MTANRSLLAHLSRRLSGQTEDLAVESLGHILSTSAASRQALTDVLGNCGVEIGGISRVETQSTGGGGERPDLAGFDGDGRERLLIEAKFWAGLTGNQPVAYLDRLPPDSPSALLVVAPSLRIDTLWAELRRRVLDAKGIDMGDGQPGAELRQAPVGVSRRVILPEPTALSLGDGNRKLILTSWRNLLGRMEAQANAAGDVSTLNNLQQLQGLAELEDTEAFLPLRPEQLSSEFPRLLPHLLGLVDNAVGKLQRAGLVSTYRLNLGIIYQTTFWLWGLAGATAPALPGCCCPSPAGECRLSPPGAGGPPGVPAGVSGTATPAWAASTALPRLSLPASHR